MTGALSDLRSMAPALLFLCAGVPLAALLDRSGFFDSLTAAIGRRFRSVPVWALWVLAAVTTALLNLDTTVVLLTPLYVRLARAAGVDPWPVALVPLLLAAFASSVLPVSNLTTLIAVDRLDLTVVEVLVHLAPASAAAVVAGWLAYRRRHPAVLAVPRAEPVDRRSLAFGGCVVGGLLVGFVVGPGVGVDPWMVALAADAVLAVRLRWVPWREVPLATAAAVAALGVVVGLVGTPAALGTLLRSDTPLAVGAATLGGAALADVVNNLPTVLIGLDGVETATPALWGWLAGLNVGAVLLPLGALANLLWWRIVRDEGVPVGLRRYVGDVVPVALPALLAATAVLVVLQALRG